MTANANDFNDFKSPEVEIVATNTSNNEGLEEVTALPFGNDAEEYRSNQMQQAAKKGGYENILILITAILVLCVTGLSAAAVSSNNAIARSSFLFATKSPNAKSTKAPTPKSSKSTTSPEVTCPWKLEEAYCKPNEVILEVIIFSTCPDANAEGMVIGGYRSDEFGTGQFVDITMDTFVSTTEITFTIDNSSSRRRGRELQSTFTGTFKDLSADGASFYLNTAIFSTACCDA